MATLFIPVGIPGCGKSGLALAIGAEITVSSDKIRESMGDVSDQSKNDQVFKEFYGHIDWNVGNFGYSTYADATNLDAHARDRLREIAGRYDYVKTHLILFRNLEQAITRNLKRDRVVPSDAMLRMIAKYEQAVIDIANEPYTYVTEVSAVR